MFALMLGLFWWAALWRIPALPGPWGTPDLLLLGVLAWGLIPHPAASLWVTFGVGAGVGFLKDLASGGPLGAWTAIFAVTAWLVTRSARTMASDHPLTRGLWLFLFAMGTIAGYALLLGFRGAWAMAGGLLGYFLVPSALATALAGLVIVPWLQPAPRSSAGRLLRPL